MMRPWLGAAIVYILSTAAAAQQFHVVASRRAIVRDEPSTSASPLAALERGDAAACIVAGGEAVREGEFYLIEFETAREGWISRYTVRLYEGPPPGAPASVMQPAMPGRDTPAYHLAIGTPRGYMQLDNPGYIVGYDPRLKIPAWVQYRLHRDDLEDPVSRRNAFAPDTRLDAVSRATEADYAAARSWDLWESLSMSPPRSGTQPNYARGHMAPSRDLSRSVDVRNSSDLLSNIAPQVQRGYNNGVWSTLEDRVRRWVIEREELTIITGPVFLSCDRVLTPGATQAEREQDRNIAPVLALPPTDRQVIYNVVGPSEVAIPTAFFKIVVDHRDVENPEVLAFLVPHFSQTTDDLATRLVSVREIEELTGLNLLSALSEQVQERIETSAATGLW